MVLADYNDQNYDYTKYWVGREYENESEFMALRRLLPKNKLENSSVIDIGGGFGRLIPVFKDRFGDITIFDFSQKLLEVAEQTSEQMGLKIKTLKGDINDISEIINQKYDAVTMIRVSHHLDNIEEVLKNIKEILKDDGIFILEIANKIHFKSSLSNLLKGNLNYFNKESVSVATKSVTFLNHHPKKIENILDTLGFKVERKLSVSNFRHPVFKKFIPLKILLFKENLMQKIGAPFYFGPSIFYLLKNK